MTVAGPPNPRALTEGFHRINRVLPEAQEVVSVAPETLAAEAMVIMRQRGYSQLPVVVEKHVIGLFSYRSYAKAVQSAIESQAKAKINLADLTVEECIEKPAFARVTDEFTTWFAVLDQDNAVLVGEASRLQGIVTPMDVLRYLYEVASPFVLVAEIELAVRALIERAVMPEQLSECIRTTLSSHYSPEKLPASLSQMTFHDYVQIITDGRNWPKFEPVFRGTRERTRAKLEEMNRLRNDVFHLRGPSVEDHERLAAFREWVLRQIEVHDLRARGGA